MFSGGYHLAPSVQLYSQRVLLGRPSSVHLYSLSVRLYSPVYNFIPSEHALVHTPAIELPHSALDDVVCGFEQRQPFRRGVGRRPGDDAESHDVFLDAQALRLADEGDFGGHIE